MKESTKVIVDYWKRRKELMLIGFGSKCQICGYNKCNSALEFHHLNPDEKEIAISSQIRSWEKTKEELEKCICVCANCHREIHAGLIDNEKLVSGFNEEKALEIDKLIEDLKTHKIVYCKKCGKEISSKATYCAQCSHEQQRKIERPPREVLKKLIRNNTFVSIGKKFNVSDNAIKK